jgi:hypothetical protein
MHGVDNLKVVSADSSAAILDEKFRPLTLIACASVLAEPPYREADLRLVEPIFREVENSYDVIVHEAELCSDLLAKVKADVVHLDISLGAVSIEELSPVNLANMRISKQAQQHILRMLPKLRKIAGEIQRVYGLEVLAIGKESVPVRIAELTAGAEAILFACAKVAEENESVLLGLPTNCQPIVFGNRVYLNSLLPTEHDVRGYAEDSVGTLKKVNILETLNPCARGFRALRICSLS